MPSEASVVNAMRIASAPASVLPTSNEYDGPSRMPKSLIWTSAALQYLGLDQFFGDNVITGEDNLRKPHPAVFLKAASMLDRPCSSIISIGDQNPTDILPAKQLGMTTIRIGSILEDADFVAPEICRALELARKI